MEGIKIKSNNKIFYPKSKSKSKSSSSTSTSTLKIKKNMKNYIVIISYLFFSLLLFLMVWAVIVIILKANNNGISVLPTPIESFKSFFYLLNHPIDGNTLINHSLSSLFRVFLGVTYAFILSVPLGMFTALNKIGDRLFRPIIEMIRPIPPIAWIPFAIITFGLGSVASSFVIFIGAFFPLLQNTYDGVRQSTKVYQDVAKSLGASKSQISWEVILPSIIPNIITGLKIAVGVGWMCVISAEMMGMDVTSGGIGYFIFYMKNIGNYSNMIAGMFMIAIIGLILNGIFKLLEIYALKWTEMGDIN